MHKGPFCVQYLLQVGGEKFCPGEWYVKGDKPSFRKEADS